MCQIIAITSLFVGMPIPPPEKMKPSPEIQNLIDKLQTDRVWLEIQKRAIRETPGLKAAQELRELGSQAVPELSQALTDGLNPIQRSNAALILGWIDHPSVLPPLRRAAVNETEETTRKLAIQALAHRRDPASLDLFLGLMKTEKSSVRGAALSALAAYFPSAEGQSHVLDHADRIRASSAVVTALDDPDGEVRYIAVSVAASVGNVNARHGLIRALEDEQRYVPVNAAQALGKLQDRRAVTPLIRVALQEQRIDFLRLYAVRALGQIGDVRAVTPLLGLLDEKDQSLRRAVIQTLGQLGDRRAVKPLIDTLSDANAEVVANAAQALGMLGDPRAVEPLIAELTRRAKAGDRLEPVATALGKLNDPRAIAPLAAALFTEQPTSDPEPIANAIGSIRHPDSLRVLVEGLLMEKSHHWANVYAGRVVNRLSGERFGNTMELQQWWQENQSEYRSKSQ